MEVDRATLVQSARYRRIAFSYSVRFGLIARRIRSIRSSGRSARVHPRYRFEIGERNFARGARIDETYSATDWPKIWRIFNVREQRVTGRWALNGLR